MRTFSFEELQSNQVPKRESFGEVLRLLRREVPNLESLDWAIVGGSALKGGYNEGSDIDLVLCFDDPDWGIVAAEVDELRAHAAWRFIPLTPAFVTTQMVAENRHTLSRGYVAHLRWAAEHNGLLCGEWAGLEPPDISVGAEAMEYFAHKIEKCLKYLSLPAHLREPALWRRWLGEIITTHKHALRRFGEVIGFDDDVEPMPIEELSESASDLAAGLGVNSSLHTLAIQVQLEAPDEPAWRMEHDRVARQGHDLLELLQEFYNQVARLM